MKNLIINGRVFPSIWRDENAPKKENTIVRHRRPAYSDPTANAALGNIERENKRRKRREQRVPARRRAGEARVCEANILIADNRKGKRNK